LNDPQSLHKYLYTHADPINGTDPSGKSLASVSISIAIGGGLIGLGGGAIVGAGITALRGGTWSEIGMGTITGGLSGAVFGSAVGFAAATGRLPIVLGEGFLAGLSNAAGEWLVQWMDGFKVNNWGKIGQAFLDGLIWGTASSAYGGVFIDKPSKSHLFGKILQYEQKFEDHIIVQIGVAAVTSFFQDFMAYRREINSGQNVRAGERFFVDASINALRAAAFAGITALFVADSNMYGVNFDASRPWLAALVNASLGTWINCIRDSILDTSWDQWFSEQRTNV
jgi:hypothetical protein